MSWITQIDYSEADAQLKKIYDQVKGPENTIDNVLKIHSLRPHTLVGHMSLYKNVLHHSSNTLPKWYMEALGVYVSFLNNCAYCVAHHFEGMKKILNNENESIKIMDAIMNGNQNQFLEGKNLEGIRYAKKLTLNLKEINETDIVKLRDSGFSDGEILEINQVVSYFNYANRTVLGLGVDLKGDILGLSPNDSEDMGNWRHS